MRFLRCLILSAIFTITAPAIGGTETSRLSLIGESSQFVELDPQRIARNTRFYDRRNQQTSIKTYRSKVVLVNFWASWCLPCMAEMPSLDQLAYDHSNDDLVIIPVSIDEDGLLAAIPFYRRLGLENLDLFVDPNGETAYSNRDNPKNAEFALYGLPITYALDRDGRILGYVTGLVDWQSDDAADFIDRLLEPAK
ncbi:TlpA disulfide reductase family protein [Thalassospira sp. MCCC 1A03138]|uniref:TlpA disulfide reductase family protein n=1 Tax=Thalassospira sp. MCCC 1A03138 TaxID=1470576 RepID=UPI000A1F9834|nr:TlpA disulfide reductase family protein [Thalassospira sp. MCCC 1A03138]